MRRCPTCHSRYTLEVRVCPIDGSTLEDAPDPLVGRTIGGRYLVCELIGSGGMGSVYRGRHQLVGRDVALKFLAPRFARDPAARERFLREARAANRIDHEHIIDITDFGETPDNLVFLVMEYLDGETISKVIERGPLPPERAFGLAFQLATALARAHELDVIHRDIKPDNIFVLQRRGGDFVKLLDFGLAKVAGEHRLTATGKVFGTPEYLSPEQARGETLTGAADQYALGCVLYEMLTGVLPFEGPGPEVILKHLQVVPPPPSSLMKFVYAEQIDTLVMRMLAKHPSERFTDAFHLADELRTLLELHKTGGRGSKLPRRSSGTRHVPPPSAEHTQPWVDAAEETWAQRFALYEQLTQRVFPAGPPAEIVRALEQMRELVAQARGLRLRLGDNVIKAKEHEDNLRVARLQMGHAVDELGQDESRIARRLLEARSAIERADEQLTTLALPVLSGLSELQGVNARDLHRGIAERLVQLGALSTLWIEAEEQASVHRGRLAAAEREREDLRFQIAQLKGRLGILSAEGESDLGLLRQEAEGVEMELLRTVEALARCAEPITRALSAVPGVLEQLASGSDAAARVGGGR